MLAVAGALAVLGLWTLSRRSKAAALAVVSLCIWMSTGWTLRLQVLLLGALTVRCNLKPAEASVLAWHIAFSHVHDMHEQPHIARLRDDWMDSRSWSLKLENITYSHL